MLIKIAERKNFKIAAYWEQAPGERRQQIERAIDELSYVLEKYGRSKAYLKVEGRPVVFVYNRVTTFQIPTSAWPEIIERVRARAGDFALMADGHQPGWAYLFDGLHTYGLYGLPLDLERHMPANRLDDLRAWAAQYYAEGVRLARQRNRISCLLIAPGWDTRKAYKVDYETSRLNGQMYRTLWQEAIRANADWILITSWNEWPEGSEIEPSLELGDHYLRLTADYSERFFNSPPVAAPPPAPLPRFAPGSNRALANLLAGRKVAVLLQVPGPDREFWAAYCGATLEHVTWKDLVDPKLFNARTYPVLIHLANEHYTSSIKTADDVKGALVRYSREGGFLVSLPFGGPWPLHYDDSRNGRPHPITDLIGLGVDSGFGAPPPGVELALHAKANVLLGVPATAPFPKTGDLRFTPASRKRVPAKDIYVPLVQVLDSTGKLYGDAAVYIEHRDPSLAPGKAVYMWMRTDEAFGTELFLPSLYHFISTRLKPLPGERK